MEIAAIVIAFVINAGIGTAVLLWRVWKHLGSPRTSGDFGRVARSMADGFIRPRHSAASRNSAFEDYKRDKLERLERERHKLQEEEREFDDFLRELRRTKDKAEFDRFMASRGRPA